MSLLPALRRDLDLIPSPVADRPGLLMRDSFGYSEGAIIIPPVLVKCLRCFDGRHTVNDLRELLVRLTGYLDVDTMATGLLNALEQNAFLDNETFADRRDTRQREFAQSATRTPAHAGTAYPAELDPLQETMRRYLGNDEPVPAGKVRAIAAPHVSPEGGWKSYRAAYQALPPEDADCTFIILGTSHYGECNKFGLTHKPYITPLGTPRVDSGIVSELASARCAKMDDYCHAVEHSIEFQVLFLQWLYGANVKVVPVLCGSFAPSIDAGGVPEDDADVREFFDRLGEISEREGDGLRWVLGIDMAHQGQRYGDAFAARAHQDGMTEVTRRDQLRMNRMLAGDAAGFWDLVRENRDDLRWCGSAPAYTFLKVMPQARGRLHNYEQWNIDDASVVSFAGLSFTCDPAPR
jgi:AmmeMemoRadiSam system protein B